MRAQLFGVGLQGKSPRVTAQKRQNCYYDFVVEGEHTRVSIHGTPGLSLLVNLGDTQCRGSHSFIGNTRLYVVHRGTLYEVDNAGVATSRGTLNTTSGNVSMADNGTEICIVDGTDGWIFDTSDNSFTEITDAQFPSSPTTVCFHNGRFIVSKGGTGEFYGSDLYDGLAWTALQFATAESIPDDLVRVVSRDELVLFGDLTTEFWADIGSAGFPYARIPGTNLQWGLAARWSACRYLDSFAFLARAPMGEVMPVYLSGYQVTPLGNDTDFLHVINRYTSFSDATAFGYMLGGHPMFQLNFPSEDASWLYDASTQLWSELKSGEGRHRAEFHADFVNKNVVTDYENGKIYRLDPEVNTDNGDEIALELVSQHLIDNDEYFTVDSLQLTMQTGVGLESGQGSNPQAMLKISKDGGNTWGTELWASIGKIGKYLQRVIWRRLGKSRDWVFKVRITDPIPRHITGTNIAVRK